MPAVLCILLSLFVSQALADEVPWPPNGAAELIGRIGCDFPRSAGIGFYALPVSGHDAYRLELRKKGDEHQYVMLMKKRSAQACDALVVAALRLPRYTEKKIIAGELRDRFAVAFECRYLGVEWSNSEAAFGMVDQSLPHGYFMPRRAWRVDVRAEKLLPVDRDLVTCARFSVHDARGEAKDR